jgi:hypothetical protein
MASIFDCKPVYAIQGNLRNGGDSNILSFRTTDVCHSLKCQRGRNADHSEADGASQHWDNCVVLRCERRDDAECGGVGVRMSSMDNEERMFANVIASALARSNGYQARTEIGGLLASISKDKKRLEPFGFKVYSQGDEDGIIEEIFYRLDITNGLFCEIGVENGLECNTLYLLHKGWRGGWIEGNIQQSLSIKEKFGSVIDKRLKVFFEIISSENIDDLLSKITSDKSGLDFLSIDIDGNDIYLFECLQHKPKVICIEYNAKFRGNLVKKQKYNPQKFWSGTDYMGSSLKALVEVGTSKGYRLVGTNITGANAFFVRDDLATNLFSENSSSEYLYNPPRYWLIFDHYKHIGHRADFGPYVDLE